MAFIIIIIQIHNRYKGKGVEHDWAYIINNNYLLLFIHIYQQSPIGTSLIFINKDNTQLVTVRKPYSSKMI